MFTRVFFFYVFTLGIFKGWEAVTCTVTLALWRDKGINHLAISHSIIPANCHLHKKKISALVLCTENEFRWSQFTSSRWAVLGLQGMFYDGLCHSWFLDPFGPGMSQRSAHCCLQLSLTLKVYFQSFTLVCKLSHSTTFLLFKWLKKGFVRNRMSSSRKPFIL